MSSCKRTLEEDIRVGYKVLKYIYICTHTHIYIVWSTMLQKIQVGGDESILFSVGCPSLKRSILINTF